MRSSRPNCIIQFSNAPSDSEYVLLTRDVTQTDNWMSLYS